MIDNKIIQRITESTGADSLIEKLSSLSHKDWQSLLLYTFEERVNGFSLNRILTQSQMSRFAQPCAISQRRIINLEYLATQILPQEFDMIELSPVVPLGTNHILAGTNQKNVLSTSRNLEVVADPTTALALECAKRRSLLTQDSSADDQWIRLASIQRNLRLQNFEKIPGFVPHFKILALETAGHTMSKTSFEISSLLEHMSYYLQLILALAQAGYEFQEVAVYFSNIKIVEKIMQKYRLDRNKARKETQNPTFSLFSAINIPFAGQIEDIHALDQELQFDLEIKYFVDRLKKIRDQVIVPLADKSNNISWLFDLERIAGIGYYTDLCFKITAKNQNGTTFPLADGGFVNWIQKLLLSKKECLLISGIGLDIILQNFYQ